MYVLLHLSRKRQSRSNNNLYVYVNVNVCVCIELERTTDYKTKQQSAKCIKKKENKSINNSKREGERKRESALGENINAKRCTCKQLKMH